MEARIARVEGVLDQINERLGSIERRLDSMDRRFSLIDQRFSWVIGLIVTSWTTTILTILFHR